MSVELVEYVVDSEALYDQIADGLVASGFVHLPVALPPELSEGLLQHVLAMADEDFRAAGVGRADDFTRNPFVRRDQIRWMSGDSAVERDYLAWMEQLRVGLNRRLFLGLFDYECHFARYPAGSFYKKHVDAFRGRSNRVLSTVLYLNPGWTLADGGQLLVYPDSTSLEPDQQVIPLMGTLVVFLSEKIPHEVALATRLRHSIAGWFRVNASSAEAVDPPR